MSCLQKKTSVTLGNIITAGRQVAPEDTDAYSIQVSCMTAMQDRHCPVIIHRSGGWRGVRTDLWTWLQSSQDC